jgi:hypothetical protein
LVPVLSPQEIEEKNSKKVFLGISIGPKTLILGLKKFLKTRDFKNGIGKRVGNEFFIRLKRLDYAFPNALPNAFDHVFDHAFYHGFAHAFYHGFAHPFDHAFLDVLNGAVFDVVFYAI